MNKKNLGSWPQVSICNQKGILCPLFKTLVVFQVRKTPLSSRDCGLGLGFRPQSHSTYGYGAGH